MKRSGKAKLYAAILVFFVLGLSGYAFRSHFYTGGWGAPEVVESKKVALSETISGGGAPYTGQNRHGALESSVTATGSESEIRAGNGDTTAGSPAATLSNSKRGWGLKPNKEHKQPEMPSGISSTLDKYGAYWIGGPGEEVVYLTFDEGYENGYTPKILDILKDNGVKAAFFVTGHYLKSQPELVKRMVDEGHIVGNHTDTHPSLPDVSDGQIKKELQDVEKKYEEITGRRDMKFLRPPKGEYSERTLAVTRELGYNNIFWSMALVDWVPMPGGPDQAYRGVMDNLHNGALILLHAVSKDNAGALDRMLKDIKARGYTFETLDYLVK